MVLLYPTFSERPRTSNVCIWGKWWPERGGPGPQSKDHKSCISGQLTGHWQVDTGVNLHGAMDFVNLAKFHSKLALSFHPKLSSHLAATERDIHPFLLSGNSSTFCFRDIV